MKYLEPAQPLSGDQPKLVTTTISAYDRDQLKAAFKSVLMGVGMMGVMHIYFKYTNPLLIQSNCSPSFLHFLFLEAILTTNRHNSPQNCL